MKMIRFLFFILSFGFLVQSGGTEDLLLPSAMQVELFPEDNPQEAENNQEETKSEKDIIFSDQDGQTKFMNACDHTIKPAAYNPQEFHSKPFLPPRR